MDTNLNTKLFKNREEHAKHILLKIKNEAELCIEQNKSICQPNKVNKETSKAFYDIKRYNDTKSFLITLILKNEPYDALDIVFYTYQRSALDYLETKEKHHTLENEYIKECEIIKCEHDFIENILKLKLKF